LGVPRQQPHRYSGLANLPSAGAVPHISVDEGTCCALFLYPFLSIIVYACVYFVVCIV